MIDDNWQEDYGTWEFSPRRFTDPKGMIDQLHAMGFKVMMWMCPFVSADSADFKLAEDGLLILDPRKRRIFYGLIQKIRRRLFGGGMAQVRVLI